jgi:hypothetical protein
MKDFQEQRKGVKHRKKIDNQAIYWTIRLFVYFYSRK